MENQRKLHVKLQFGWRRGKTRKKDSWRNGIRSFRSLIPQVTDKTKHVGSKRAGLHCEFDSHTIHKILKQSNMLQIIDFDELISDVPQAASLKDTLISVKSTKMLLDYILEYCAKRQVEFHSIISTGNTEPLMFIIQY